MVLVSPIAILTLFTESLNLLEDINNVFSYLYQSWERTNSEKLVQEKWRLDVLEEQIIKKLSIFHNQQTAIFIVMSLLIVMIFTLIFNSY